MTSENGGALSEWLLANIGCYLILVFVLYNAFHRDITRLRKQKLPIAMSDPIANEDTERGRGGGDHGSQHDQNNSLQSTEAQTAPDCHCIGQPQVGHRQYFGKHSSFEVATKLAEIVVAIFVGAALICVGVLQYWVYTRQAGIMNKQASIAETQNTIASAAQRAFVFEKDVLYSDITVDGRRIWRAAFRWDNSGQTPSKNASVKFVCTGLPGSMSIADPYAILRITSVAKSVFEVAQTFPPREPKIAGECEFFNDELLKAQKHEITLYKIAEVTYTDVFDVPHIARHCEIMYSIEGDVAGFGNIIVTGSPCIRYNCTDDECKKEDAEPNLPPERLKSFHADNR